MDVTRSIAFVNIFVGLFFFFPPAAAQRRWLQKMHKSKICTKIPILKSFGAARLPVALQGCQYFFPK